MPLIGGQAVIGGVMMKGPRHMAIAVRSPSGKIEVHAERVRAPEDHPALLRLPFVRGVVTLAETLVLGYRALTYSANASLPEGEEKLSWKETALTLVLAVALALALFKLVPLLIAEALSSLLPAVEENYLLYNLADGAAKILLFLAYLGVMGLIPEVKGVFAFHGAEHKAVNCLETGKALTVENTRPLSTSHPRCGTTFVLVVLLFSVAVYLLIPRESPLLVKYLLRLALLPVIAGVSYEGIRLASRGWRHAGVRSLLAPCLAVQALTTREPDDSQMEVALAALKKVLSLERG